MVVQGVAGSSHSWEPRSNPRPRELPQSFCFYFTIAPPCSLSHRLRCESHTLQMTPLKSRQDKGKVLQEPLDKSVYFVTSACSSWAHGKEMKRGLESQPFGPHPSLVASRCLTESPSPVGKGTIHVPQMRKWSPIFPKACSHHSSG